jgi:hypothetical protein
MPDSLELQFGSSPFNADTDGDGASDLAECVLRTLPFSAQSGPAPEQLAAPASRVLGFIENLDFHFFVAVYVPTGGLASIQNAGALLYAPNVQGYGPAVLDLNPLIFSGDIDTQSIVNGASITTSDSWIPQDSLNVLIPPDDPHVQFTAAFSAVVSGAAVADVTMFTTTASYDYFLLSLSSFDVKTSMSAGSTGAFRPLQPASLPPGWIPNSACIVTTALVGVELGSILVLQTTSANCEPLVPALCSPASCNEQTGRVFKVIDPCSFGICR